MEHKQYQDIEKLLAEGNTIQLQPKGYSMYPLLMPGRDEARIVPAEVACLKRGDVVLYRREQGILVLHRIFKRVGDEFYLVGDNQKEIEGPLRSEQMKGILIGVVRKGKYTSVRNPLYLMYAQIWLVLRPFRPFLSHFIAGVKRTLRKK